MDFELLKKLCVRIDCANKLGGSGVIIKSPEHPEIIYIMTAKHCIDPELPMDEYSFIHNDCHAQYIKIKEIVLHPLYDLAILIIAIEEPIKIPELHIIYDAKKISDPLFITGFPNAFEGDKIHIFNGRLINCVNESCVFEFLSDQNLTSFDNPQYENIKGLSGSGVFSTVGNKIYLNGIAINDKGAFNVIECLFLGKIIKYTLDQSIEFRKKPKNEEGKSTYLKKEKKILPLLPTAHYLDFENKRIQDELFPLIAKGEAVLIIGPSFITNDSSPFFSDIIIESYSNKISINPDGVDNLTEFIDAISALENVGRDDFDLHISQYIEASEQAMSENYKILSYISWREVITLNPDIFFEEIFKNDEKELIVINKKSDYTKGILLNQIKYVKLHGCMSDKKHYPFVISSSDLKRNTEFQKQIINSLKSISVYSPIIFVGFSSKDRYAKKMFESIFDPALQQRWIYIVDNNYQDLFLPSAINAKRCIIRLSVGDFLKKYDDWEEENSYIKSQRKRNGFHKTNNLPVGLTNKILNQLGDNIVQLGEKYNKDYVEKRNFYEGAEPTFFVIKQNYDIVKESKVLEIKQQLRRIFEEEAYVTVALLEGSYGSGKSTFTYRVVHELINEMPKDVLSFEVIDPDKLPLNALCDLFKSTGANKFILLVSEVDRDTAFKSIFNLQQRLNNDHSLEDFNIIILSSIRENVLVKHTSNKKNSKLFYSFNIDCDFDKPQIIELVEKLNSCNVIKYRDEVGKSEIVNNLFENYHGDTLVSFLNLISDGNHKDYILKAYNMLSRDAQKAFLLTSLVYRYKIKMPINLLCLLLNKPWDEFIEKIVKEDGKGILLHEFSANKSSLDPDIFFTTRHPIISDILVELILKNNDSLFKEYKKLIDSLLDNMHNTNMLVDLLKALDIRNDLSLEMINRLYDRAYNNFQTNEIFVLHYAANLGRRNTEKDYLNAIRILSYVQSERDDFKPNHLILHRRGLISFKLATHYFEQRKIEKVYSYLSEARDFFERKKVYDPCSAYSYVDLIRLEIWCLENLVHTEDEKRDQRIFIESLIDEALRLVYDNIEWIKEQEVLFTKNYNMDRLSVEGLYKSLEDEDERPYSLILLFYYWKKNNNTEETHKIIGMLEDHKYMDSISLILMKYYTDFLYIAQCRINFYDLIKNNINLKNFAKINYLFAKYVAAAYNKHWQEVFENLDTIKKEFSISSLNSQYSVIWKDLDGKPMAFEGNLIKNHSGRIRAHIKILGKDFFIQRGKFNLDEIPLGTNVEVNLGFFFTGIKAKIIKSL